MDTSASGYSYLYLDGYTLTNAGTFDVPADGNSGPMPTSPTAARWSTPGPGDDGILQIYSAVTFTNATGGSVVNNGTFTDGTYVQDGGRTRAPRWRRRLWS